MPAAANQASYSGLNALVTPEDSALRDASAKAPWMSVGLPPIRIHVGDDELLLDDTRRYVEHAVGAGVDAELEVWMGMPHGFVAYTREFDAARQALGAIGAFLTQRFL